MVVSNDESSAAANNFNIHENSYRYTLNLWYQIHHDVSLRNALKTQSQMNPDHSSSGTTVPRKYWTATFLCPITGETCVAGKLPGGEESTLLEGGGAGYYYLKKKHALQAAAMTALNFVTQEEESHP